jgi:DNA ligase-1
MEWKWDGIRAQLIKRGGQVYLWSRGEELITERFPEIAQAGAGLPDGTVLDGEVLAWANERPLPFQVLQQRIGRLKLTAKILSEAPVVFQAYDLLELAGQDTRPWPLIDRRTSLTELISNPFASPSLLRLSPRVEGPDWESLRTLLCESRQRGVEGLMIKRLSSPYQTGRKRGDWWKWKIEPFTVDVVMIYAQAGRGRRANLHTDYTFAVWNAGELVPIAKAYSGLSDAEINQLDRWIRAHTLERFGPVRSVEPQQVFELAFEGIAASSRHKSKIALRFPRIARWRTDKPAVEANTLQDLEALLRAQSPSA